MTGLPAMLTEFPFPTRERYGDASASDASPALALPSDCPQARAGEIVLTDGQKVALLKMRGSDWSKAVLKHLKATGFANCDRGDFIVCAERSLARLAGSYHVLTQAGRWRADQVAHELAKGMHVITYDFGSAGVAAQAKCLCGWRTFKSRHSATNFAQAIGRAGQRHLEHVGAVQ